MPRTLISLRLDEGLRSRLASAAQRRRTTPSELARRAIESWLDGDEGRARLSPAESVGDLIGRLAGGARDRSTRSDLRLPRLSAARTARSRTASKRKK